MLRILEGRYDLFAMHTILSERGYFSMDRPEQLEYWIGRDGGIPINKFYRPQ